jgi:hypothetical protein
MSIAKFKNAPVGQEGVDARRPRRFLAEAFGQVVADD